MKKILFSALSAILLLGACSREAVPEAGRVTVRFSVPATKAAGDGSAADRLVIRAFSADGTPLEALNTVVERGNGGFTADFRLVKNTDYQFVFFAESAAALAHGYYTLDGKTLRVDYEAIATSRDEADAFYAFQAVSVGKTDLSVPVLLSRPFAQVNVGSSAEDIAAAAAAGLDIAGLTTALTIRHAGVQMDLETGVVTGDTEAAFAPGPLPDGTLTADGKDYTWLAFAYILPGAPADVVFTGTSGGETVVKEITEVPVSVNHRTDLLGFALTTGGKLNK